MSKKIMFRVGFLGAIVLAVFLELVAVFDSNPDTEPLTNLIVAYVPVEVFWLLFGGLVTWLVVHFGRRRFRKG